MPALGVRPGVVAHPWPVVSAAGASGVSVSAAGADGVFYLQQLGWEQCVSKKNSCWGDRPERGE